MLTNIKSKHFIENEKELERDITLIFYSNYGPVDFFMYSFALPIFCLTLEKLCHQKRSKKAKFGGHLETE